MPNTTDSTTGKLFFSDCVKQHRKDIKRISQEDMAKQLNVSLKTYQNWENKKACPTIDDIYAVCNILDCDVDFLFGKQSLPRKLHSTIHDETGLSQDAITQILELKDRWGYAPILSALFESPNFIHSLHRIYSALWCQKSASQRIAESWISENPILNDLAEESQQRAKEIAQDVLRTFSRYSADFVIVPRAAQSTSFLQEAKDNFGDAIKDALQQLESNQSMCENLLQVAKMELKAVMNSADQETK